MRETSDSGYLDRARKLVDQVLSVDANDYEALRLRSQIELERHNFTGVVENARRLGGLAPDDPWNWGIFSINRGWQHFFLDFSLRLP